MADTLLRGFRGRASIGRQGDRLGVWNPAGLVGSREGKQPGDAWVQDILGGGHSAAAPSLPGGFGVPGAAGWSPEGKGRRGVRGGDGRVGSGRTSHLGENSGQQPEGGWEGAGMSGEEDDML